MPKTDIDYSNTIIYKITCKDIAITDVYVGHTTNFVQRKHSHKQSCLNVKSNNYTCKLYEVIRDNGGWNNWKMEIINFFKCKDHYEARTKEQEYFISLDATLNSIEPMPKPKVIMPIINIKKDTEIFGCTVCNIQCNNSKLLEKHNASKKHLRILNTNDMKNNHHPVAGYKFVCIKCNYSCNKESDFKKHLETIKHNGFNQEFSGTIKVVQHHCCKICDKIYKTASGLWKHTKICYIKEPETYPSNNYVLDSSSTEIKALTNIVLEIVKSNTELQKQYNDLQKQIFELCKRNSITNNNNIT